MTEQEEQYELLGQQFEFVQKEQTRARQLLQQREYDYHARIEAEAQQERVNKKSRSTIPMRQQNSEVNFKEEREKVEQEIIALVQSGQATVRYDNGLKLRPIALSYDKKLKNLSR